jgi:hypothetical protein
MANYYGVYSGDGFACAPLEAQAWWGKQGGVCGGALRVLNISHEVWKLTTHFCRCDQGKRQLLWRTRLHCIKPLCYF